MEYWQKDIINKMYTNLVSHTKCSNVFLSRFLTANIISEEEHNRLMRLPHQAFVGVTEQNSEFYDIIKQRVGAFRQLYFSLQGTRQSGLATELLKFTRNHSPEEHNILVEEYELLHVDELSTVATKQLSSCVLDPTKSPPCFEYFARKSSRMLEENNESDETNNGAYSMRNQRVMVTGSGDVSDVRSYENVTLNSTYNVEQGGERSIPDKMPKGVDKYIGNEGSVVLGDTMKDLTITSTYYCKKALPKSDDAKETK